MKNAPIRVLLVDDSAVARGLISRALETDTEIEVAGTAMHGKAAISWMEKHPVDIAVLDVEMPVMDGIETLKNIQKKFPRVHVIMASSLTYEGGETTIRALALGAAGCIAKPQVGSTNESIQQLVSELIPLVKALGNRTKLASTQGQKTFKTLDPNQQIDPQILIIGCSTGGPQALSKLLSGLPPQFPLPIAIVQHMPPMFTPILAKHIETDSGRPSSEAADGKVIEANHTYVAPGDYHAMIVKRGEQFVFKLNQEPKEHYCRPSVNPLFRSAAKCYGNSVLAVMLTGMGSDGIEGTQLVVDNGGYVIAQDEPSSVVWGMPGAVAQANLAHKVLPLENIAFEIQRVCQKKEVARV